VTISHARIVIRGSGLAGVAAAKLLHDRGMDVRFTAWPQRNDRIIAIPIETLTLASSLFDFNVADLKIGTIVTGRRVDWSDDDATIVPQTALACDAGGFAAALADRLPDRLRILTGADDDADWTIEASGRSTDNQATGGRRVGQLARIADRDVQSITTIAATPHGWTFTLPHPAGGTAVLMVTPSASMAATTPEAAAERLTAEGLNVAAADILTLSSPQLITPHLAQPLAAGNRLRVGDAAMAIDPLRGDGVGFALRGALLAQAVIAAIEGGGDRAQLFNHYDHRLREVFVSHLRGCSSHYRAARYAEIWRPDIVAMDRLAERIEPVAGGYEFRLDERDLVAQER
jgi:2-polyprenyl-6-methoxyphenol hydroxylase-like FAD-dependent oxidoreductase